MSNDETVTPASAKHRGGRPKKDPGRPKGEAASVVAQGDDAIVIDTRAIRQRRIRTGEPNRAKPREYRLRKQDEPMVVRTVYLDMHSDGSRYAEAVEAGWEPVAPTDMAANDAPGMSFINDRVHVGANGKEVLMKMPSSVFNAIQKAKGDRIERSMQSEKKRRAAAMAALEREQKTVDTQDEKDELERTAGHLGGFIETEYRQVVDRVPVERK